jgi:hypothetical protein
MQLSVSKRSRKIETALTAETGLRAQTRVTISLHVSLCTDRRDAEQENTASAQTASELISRGELVRVVFINFILLLSLFACGLLPTSAGEDVASRQRPPGISVNGRGEPTPRGSQSLPSCCSRAG